MVAQENGNGSGGGGRSLQGTDFISRTLAFVLDDAWSILKSMLPYVTPMVMLALWPLVNPEGFAGQVQQTLANLQATGRFNTGPSALQWCFVLASGVLETVLIAGFAAGQHRRVLHQVVPLERSLPDAVPPYVGYWLLTGLAISILTFLYFLLLTIVAMPLPRWMFFPLAITGLFVMLAVAMRGILIFPAISVGDRAMTLERSFKLTRQAIWRMLLSIILIFLVLIAIYIALGIAIGLVLTAASLSTRVIVLTVVQLILEFLSTATFVTYVSLVYARLAHGRTPSPSHW